MNCLKSLHSQTCLDFTVVVYDDGSTDGTQESIIASYPDTVLLKGDRNLWWTRAINKCIDYALGQAGSNDLILTLNNDLEVAPDYLEELLAVHRRYPNAVITSSNYDITTRQLYDPEQCHSWLQAKSRPVNQEQESYNGTIEVAEVSHAPGRGTLIPVTVFKKIGLYDECHLPHYGADYDFTFRAARKGFTILVVFYAKLYSYVDETGLTVVRKQFSFANFIDYLTNRKSPANLISRFWLAFNNCPKIVYPSYLVLDFIRIAGSYFRFQIQRCSRMVDKVSAT